MLKYYIKAFMFCVISFQLSIRLMVFVHEVLGHMLAIKIVGGHLTSALFHPLGEAALTYRNPFSNFIDRATIGLSGCIVTMLIGFCVYFVAQRKCIGPLVKCFLFSFSYISIRSTLYYFGNGFYNGTGDFDVFWSYTNAQDAKIVLLATVVLLVITCARLIYEWALSVREFLPNSHWILVCIFLFGILLSSSTLYSRLSELDESWDHQSADPSSSVQDPIENPNVSVVLYGYKISFGTADNILHLTSMAAIFTILPLACRRKILRNNSDLPWAGVVLCFVLWISIVVLLPYGFNIS